MIPDDFTMDGAIFGVVAVTLQLFGFLDKFLTAVLFIAVLGVALTVVGTVAIRRGNRQIDACVKEATTPTTGDPVEEGAR